MWSQHSIDQPLHSISPPRVQRPRHVITDQGDGRWKRMGGGVLRVAEMGLPWTADGSTPVFNTRRRAIQTETVARPKISSFPY